MRDLKRKRNMNKRVLVTGGAGFIGSHLCEKLLTSGKEVICIDNFFTGRKENIIHLLGNPYFEVYRHDVSEPFTFEVDEIYNLACPASPVHYKKHPVKTIQTCIQGSINALELARRLNVPILQASTSEVYGDPLLHPQKESYWGNVNPIGERACYDEGKRCAETIFTAYKSQHNVKTRIARISNTYGPRMAKDDGRVISNFVNAALKNENIYIYGDGKNTRSFCYIDDMILGLIKLMKLGIETPVNIGNPNEYWEIRTLAALIKETIGSKSEIKYISETPDDPKRRQLDISLIKGYGWKPLISLDEGLKHTIRYFSKKEHY